MNFVLICCFFIFSIATGTRLKIVRYVFPDAPALNQVKWDSESENNDIYCMASKGKSVQFLAFECIDCNDTNLILGRQEDLSAKFGFPAIKLHDVQVTKELHGKTLACFGSAQSERVAEILLPITVHYLEQPSITNSRKNGPVQISGPKGGNRFYVECRARINGTCVNSRNLVLVCSVDGNPPANEFWWTGSGGQRIGAGDTIEIGQNELGESISCHASNAREFPKVSPAVKIDAWDRPTVQFSVQEPRNLSADAKIKTNSKVRMSCTAAGFPKPTVYWHRIIDGEVLNASCENQFEIGSGRASGFYKTESDCAFSVRNYSFEGRYYCSACTVIAQNYQVCNDQQRTPSRQYIDIDVVGKPQISPITLSDEYNNHSYIITVETTVCADPEPSADQVVWKNGQVTVVSGQKTERHSASQLITNGTNCYFLWLKIAPVHKEDIENDLELTVLNKHGQTNSIFVFPHGIPIWESDTFAVFASVGRPILIILIILIIIIIIIALLCWKCACCICCCGRRYNLNAEPRELPDKDYVWHEIVPVLETEPRGPSIPKHNLIKPVDEPLVTAQIEPLLEKEPDYAIFIPVPESKITTTIPADEEKPKEAPHRPAPKRRSYPDFDSINIEFVSDSEPEEEEEVPKEEEPGIDLSPEGEEFPTLNINADYAHLEPQDLLARLM